jgi:hypothetical protein
VVQRDNGRKPSPRRGDGANYRHAQRLVLDDLVVRVVGTPHPAARPDRTAPRSLHSRAAKGCTLPLCRRLAPGRGRGVVAPLGRALLVAGLVVVGVRAHQALDREQHRADGLRRRPARPAPRPEDREANLPAATARRVRPTVSGRPASPAIGALAGAGWRRPGVEVGIEAHTPSAGGEQL